MLYEAKRDPNRCPSHPGEMIEDILLDLDQTKTELALLLGISRQHFHDIIKGRKPVTPTVAARLGKLFGGGTESWLRIQAAHDAWKAERAVDLSAIPTLRATPKEAAE